SQLIAAAIVLFPAVLTLMQSETGLALVYFSFFIVMFREGLPSIILVIGFAIAALVIATLVIEPNTLAIALTVIAALAVYVLRRQIKRKKAVFTTILLLWVLCVGVQRFAVPYIFKNI